MATTLHGRNSRLYLGVGSDAASPIPKASNAAASAISKYDLNMGSDFAEDTSQGDTTKTYVTGLPDFAGSFDMFWQDVVAVGAVQHKLVDAAIAGTTVKFYAYPGGGAGITSVYFYGTVYLSLKSMPQDVGGLIMASFDMKASGAITYVHP